MSRTVLAVGNEALLRALKILGRTQARYCLIASDGDTLLLNESRTMLEWTRGDTLYEEERARAFTGQRPVWLRPLLPAQITFALRMAETMAPWWGPRGSICAWVAAFGSFYSSQRSDIEFAGRYTAMFLDGLFAVRSFRSDVYEELVAAMGSGAAEVFERWVKLQDAAGLLGILIGSQGERTITVAGLPREFRELEQSPIPAAMYARMRARIEEASGRLAPVIERLRRSGFGRQ